MAHPAQHMWCSYVSTKFPEYFKNRTVLDVGSLDINGNNRQYFTNCTYIGIDIGPGRNVDFICRGHEFFPNNFMLPFTQFDTIISTECFEHDKNYKLTLAHICTLLKPGGLFTFTCATTGRPEHGTTRTTIGCSPYTNDYYKNLTEVDICSAISIEKLFSKSEFNILETDLRFWGIKYL